MTLAIGGLTDKEFVARVDFCPHCGVQDMLVTQPDVLPLGWPAITNRRSADGHESYESVKCESCNEWWWEKWDISMARLVDMYPPEPLPEEWLQPLNPGP